MSIMRLHATAATPDPSLAPLRVSRGRSAPTRARMIGRAFNGSLTGTLALVLISLAFAPRAARANDAKCTFALLDAEDARLQRLFKKGPAPAFWEGLRTSRLRLNGCDDRDAAEGFDRLVTEGLVKYWHELAVLDRLIGREPSFGEFVVSHLGGDADARDVLALARSRCPKPQRSLCQRLEAAAAAAVKEGNLDPTFVPKYYGREGKPQR